jgi:hypothetical protein
VETIVPFNYSTLPQELRLQALGLPLPDKNPGGRPPGLSLYGAVLAVERVQTLANAAALDFRQDDSIFVRLRRKLRSLQAKQAAPHRIKSIQSEMDAAGRFSSVPVKRPSPGTFGRIERKVAREFGISPRQLRRLRSDKDIKVLVSKPVWEPTELDREGRGLFLIRKTIDALLSRMTPERRAKEERIGVHAGVARTLDHPPDLGTVGCALGNINPAKFGTVRVGSKRLNLLPFRNHELGILRRKFGLPVSCWPEVLSKMKVRKR